MGICVDTARTLGLEEGDAHVIRNAGGRVTDAIRSIVTSQQLLGTREIVIVHHVRRLSEIKPELRMLLTDWIIDRLRYAHLLRRGHPQQDQERFEAERRPHRVLALQGLEKKCAGRYSNPQG
jgi:carbonic anhydrase